MSDKPILIFTNFWDANSVIDFRFLLLHDVKKEELYRIHLLKNKSGVPENFSVHSIALSHPDLTRQANMQSMNRLDFFCPTYDILKRYKGDNNWDAYRKDYTEIIKKRKNIIKDWASSLKPNWVYFLCCWEDTSHGAHCHREILHKAFSESKIMSQKMILVYRHGEKKYKKESNGNSYAEAMRLEIEIPQEYIRDPIPAQVTTTSSSYVVTENGQPARMDLSGTMANIIQEGTDYMNTPISEDILEGLRVGAIRNPRRPRNNNEDDDF